MPIKFQALGGSGGTDLLLKVAPNISVTLSREGYTSTLTANEQGQALFKKLKAGTYVVVVQNGNIEFRKEITIPDKLEESFGVKQIKDLPLGAKLKFSSGKTFKLLKKNAKGHPSNSAVFWSEYITQNHRFDGVQYFDSYVHNTIMSGYYNELNEQEKRSTINYERIATTYQESGSASSKKGRTNFYLLTLKELGCNSHPVEYENLGFGNNASRIKNPKNGIAQDYCTADVYESNLNRGYFYNRFIQENGTPSSGNDVSGRGMVPACDLKGDAYVILDTDGYYKILKV